MRRRRHGSLRLRSVDHDLSGHADAATEPRRTGPLPGDAVAGRVQYQPLHLWRLCRVRVRIEQVLIPASRDHRRLVSAQVRRFRTD